MKRYVKSNNDMQISGDELALEIEKLLKKENIPYIYVECIDTDPEDGIIIVGVTYGDWKNDNDYADTLVEQAFKPTQIYHEDKDPYDYLDDETAARFEGTDSCVTRHEWIWEP